MTLARVVWDDVYVANVLDQDLFIKGDVLLPLGATSIEAIHSDVTVTLNQDVKISASWAGESQLYLKVAEGRTINFVMDYNITLVGSSQSHDDLLVVQSGPGLVDVAIGAGKQFKITSEGTSGGVQMYVLMYGGDSAPCDEYCTKEEYCCDEYCEDEYCALGNGQNENSESRPVLLFRTLEGDEYFDDNREVIIGPRSRLSFLSSRPVDFAQDAALIEFDAVTMSDKRMVLKIEDTGAFTVAGHFTCQRNGGCITLANIDLSRPAGNEAIWSIFNSLGSDFSAGLLVLNENNTLFELLQDPTGLLGARDISTEFIGQFDGNRLGAVIGADGLLWVRSNAYLDYVGLALNQKPITECMARTKRVNLTGFLKERNPSALFIDGSHNPDAIAARFLLSNQSAVFFRSGIANDGTIRGLDDMDPFTVDANAHTKGIGNIVFDVEGRLEAFGLSDDGGQSSKIELLSLEVVPSGGSLFVGSSETNFPMRTFNMEDDALLAYNTGAFLINNSMNLYNTSLSHTDTNHHVFQDDDINSEPTYVGGESFRLFGGMDVIDAPMRPNISFFNSRFLLNTDVALTGVDLVVPDLVDEEEIVRKNNVDFVFYSNGACIDNGTGRQMVLGTRIGSFAADGCTRVDNDAHLDVIQLFDGLGADFPITDTDNQVLHLTTAFNDDTIIDEDIEDTDTIHTIFLGNTSNISIGSNVDISDFNITTNPWLVIQGNFFSFTTRGGLNGCPSTSNVTGQGGIFVDLNGKLSIDPGFLAMFCVLVTRTRNGIVDLPPSQVIFCDDLGIVNGDTDLSTTEGQVLVGPGQEVGDLILDWQILQQDCPNFIPFLPVGPCCPEVMEENITSLPIIEGTVNNLIIRGSRLGNPASFIVRGGTVRNITFAINNNGCCLDQCENISGQAPVATIVLEDNGTVVLSDQMLGAIGIIIIANGSGRVDLAGDITLAAQCSFVKGPDFVDGDVLTINADIAHEIILPASSRFDLRSFDVVTDLVQFTGEAQLAVEPGSSIITGLGTLSFANNSQIRFEAAPNVTTFFQAIPHGNHNETLPPLQVVPAANTHNQYDFLTDFGADLHNTDNFRIKLMGEGVIELRDNAQAFLLQNAFVGVETTNDAFCPVETTNLELRLLNNAQFIIGELNLTEGGVLQIGNVEDQDVARGTRQTPHSVSFTLTIDGDEADFFIGSQGFMGLGVGIERFDGIDPATGFIVPNENIVNTLFNVKTITFNFLQGRFEHDRIFRGDNPNASLFAINGDEPIRYNVNFATIDDGITTDFNLAGGGNMILTYSGTGGIHPIVLDQDGQVEVAPGVFDPRLWTSIMASSALQDDQLQEDNLTGLELFELLKTHDAVLEINRPNTFGRANSSADDFETVPTVQIDTVANGQIVRTEVSNIIGSGNSVSKRQQADEIGAVFVNIDHQNNDILTATQMGR